MYLPISYEQRFETACRLANRHKRDGRGFEVAGRYLARYQIGTFGTELVSIEDREAEYINTGDTYSATILREGNGDFVVTSWGDWYETAEHEHEEETETIRCGWCSHFTPMDQQDWRDVVCESCGHHVDGSL